LSLFFRVKRREIRELPHLNGEEVKNHEI